MQVYKQTTKINGEESAYRYTYDANGNITSVNDGTYTTTYVYDSANQLLRENNEKAGKTWGWTYDDGGNIRSKTEYAYTTGTVGEALDTTEYSYSASSWGDLLISHDGNTIVSDNSGNMLSYGDDKTFTWKHGRELSGMTDDSGSWTFEYNADGLRVYRSNGTTEYKYYYNGDKLTRMVANGENITFGYDASGVPQYVIYGGHRYFYLTNLQGDVTGIVSMDGEIVVAYSYDAWGNPMPATGEMAATLGKDNPLRYRGYVYDEETGLYYLQSRYYDPALGRFINADGYTSTGQGFVGNNMFAYCNNSPVNLIDTSGQMPITTAILIGSAIIGIVCAGYTAYKEYQAGYSTGRIIGDSICSGFAGFSLVYSGGMSAYQCYQNYCYLNGITPMTEIGGTGTVTSQLQTCANTANASVSGNGPVVGTKKHTVFASEVNKLGNPNLRTEVSYLNGMEVKYGTKNSIRFDVVQYDLARHPIAAWDLKTGAATLSAERIAQMQTQSGLNIPIYIIK